MWWIIIHGQCGGLVTWFLTLDWEGLIQSVLVIYNLLVIHLGISKENFPVPISKSFSFPQLVWSCKERGIKGEGRRRRAKQRTAEMLLMNAWLKAYASKTYLYCKIHSLSYYPNPLIIIFCITDINDIFKKYNFFL